MKSATKLAARFSFEAIGTLWQIDTVQSLSAQQQAEIVAYCDSFDAYFSRFREHSMVRRLAESAGSIEVPDTWVPLVRFYAELTQVTHGLFTACIGDSLTAAGYDAQYSLKVGDPQQAPSWIEIVRLNGHTLTVSQPVLLDFGAAGKGFLVDCIAALVRSWGIESATIDASGDIYTWGEQVETVGLEDPRNTHNVLGTVKVQQQALCASAIHRRSWGDGVHHIMNPTSGKSTTGVQATWVRADSAMIADGLATALFLVDPETLRVVTDFDYVRLHQNGSLDYSAGFKGQLYI